MALARAAIGGMVAAALLAGSASPAAARPRYWGHGYHHHRGGSTFGALLGGLVIGGAAVAIATSVDRRNRGYDATYDAPPPPPPPAPQQAETQGQAVDRCTAAAEDESGPAARVNDITRVTRDGSGWRVEGVIDTGTKGYDGYRKLGSFTCAVEYGEVRDLRFGEEPRG